MDTIDLVLRSQKGSALTWDEGDANLVALREAILTLASQWAAGRVVIGDEPVAGDRTGVLWIPSDFRGAFVWNADTDQWDRIREPVLYAESTGSAGDYTVTLTEITAYAQLVGRLWVLKPNHDSTGASQLRVGTLDYVAMRYNGAPIEAGMLVAGNPVAMIYDGSYFHVLNVVEQPLTGDDISALFKTVTGNVPDGVSSVTMNHSLGRAPVALRVVMVMGASTEAGYSEGDEVDASEFFIDSADNDFPGLTVSANDTSIVVARPPVASYGLLRIAHKTTGVDTAITHTNWTLKAYLL